LVWACAGVAPASSAPNIATNNARVAISKTYHFEVEWGFQPATTAFLPALSADGWRPGLVR